MVEGDGRKVPHWLLPILAAGALGGAASGAASAAPARPSPFLGHWLISAARPAPWVDAKDPSSAPLYDNLIGKSVIYQADRIVGPRPLACRGPHYRMLDYPPDSLFQGGLTRPTQQAAALGFHGSTIRTLETGCAGWIDFHFVDADTALFALNNMVYTLRHQR